MPGRLAATSLPGQGLSQSKNVFHNKSVYNSVQNESRDSRVKASVQTNPQVSPPDRSLDTQCVDIAGYLARTSTDLDGFSGGISVSQIYRSRGFNTSFETDSHLRSRSGQALAAQAEERGAIQLDECNTVRGLLKCGMKLDIVVDSGASMTLISSEVVEQSEYLKSLESTPTASIRIRIADGSYIYSTHKLTFKVKVQNYVFELMA